MPVSFLDVRTRLLLAGDLVTLGLFAIAGRRNHDEATGLAAVGAVSETALPFVLGWIAAVILVRTARLEGVTSVGTTLRQTVPGWVIAFPVVVLLRALVLGRFSPWTFYLVAFLLAFALLAAWRVAFIFGGRWLTGAAAAR
jgi:hypothetical protein